MLLFRPEYYQETEENKGLAELIVAKQRNGPTGTVRLHFFESTMRFGTREPSMAEPFSV
jgi:replicative DNA helicase